MSSRSVAIAVAMVAAAGLVFAAFSTFDFVQHLDRQVHDLHCSFAPGLVEADETSTGCQVTLLSPYSSVMRTAVWGGIPVSLPGMAMFALLLFRAIDLVTRPAAQRGHAGAILAALSVIPFVTSVVMGGLSLYVLDATCKLCVGIYICSGLTFVLSLAAWRMGRGEADLAISMGMDVGVAPESGADPESSRDEDVDPAGDEHDAFAMPPATSVAVAPASAATAWLAASAQAFAFIALPVVTYAALAPDHEQYIGKCGGLVHPEDPYSVMVPLGTDGGDAIIVEVFDPLCPACKGLEERLESSGLTRRVSRRAVMFPLDSECNWMVTRSLHPGACRVSKAVLCAAMDESTEVAAVVSWAFDHQEALIEAGEKNLEEVTAQVIAQFPSLAQCVDSPEVASQLNKSLRWTVSNQLAVLTPQLFVDGVKVCDEDTDLGLEFTLDKMLAMHDAGTLAALAPEASDDEAALVPGSEATPKTEAGAKRKRKSPPRPGAKPKPRDEPSAKPDADDPPAHIPTAPTLPGVKDLPPPVATPAPGLGGLQ